MQDIHIVTDRESYYPGDTINGQVVFVCDECLDTNRVTATLICAERTAVTHGSGKSQHTHSDTFEHIRETQELMPKVTIQVGETRLDFSFTLSPDLPGSYHGMHGRIEYSIGAKAELSRRLDKKATAILLVELPVPSVTPAEQSGSIMRDETEAFRVEVLNDVIEPSKYLPIRFMLLRESNFRGLRLEIVHREFVWPDNQKTTTENIMAWVSVPKEEMHYESWQEVAIQLPDRVPTTFLSRLIETSCHLKATLDIPWSLDKTVYLPLRKGITDDLYRETDAAFGTDFGQRH